MAKRSKYNIVKKQGKKGNWKNLIGKKMREKKLTGSTLSKEMGMHPKIFYRMMKGDAPPASILLEKVCEKLDLAVNGLRKLIREDFPEGNMLWSKQYDGHYVYYNSKQNPAKKGKMSKKKIKQEVKKMERMLKNTPSTKKVFTTL
jgi:hypothetical protein